jgi:hypothetical protein
MHGDLHLHPSCALDDQLAREFAVAQRVGARHWQAARLRGRGLDARLARGVPPESDAALADRARHLTRRAARRRLARRLERVARDAQGAIAEDLRTLADRLGGAGPVAPRGVARAQLLVNDGWRPSDPGRSPHVMRGAVVRAITALDAVDAVDA